MNRSRVKAGSALAVLTALLAAATAASAVASDPISADYWFGGTRLAFDRPQAKEGALAVASDDFGLGRVLSRVGATLSYAPGQRYVVIATADRRAITFTLGDARFTAGTVQETAPFAPYVDGSVVYLPFVALAQALYLDPVRDGRTVVFQPEIAALDVRTAAKTTYVTLRGASALRFKRLTDPGSDRLSLAFIGSSSTLEHDRSVASPSLGGVTITTGGTPKNPTTVVDFDVVPGSVHALQAGTTANALTLAFAPAGTSLAGIAVPAQGDANSAGAAGAAPPARTVSTPVPPVSPRAAAPPLPHDAAPSRASQAAPSALPSALALGQTLPAAATVSAVDLVPGDESLGARITVVGDAAYEWHRLADGRWYVDFEPATLAIPAQDTPLRSSVASAMRVKAFVGPADGQPTVRVAFTTTDPASVSVVRSEGGMTVAIAAGDDGSARRVGYGRVHDGRMIATDAPGSPALVPAQTVAQAYPAPPAAVARGAYGAAQPTPVPAYRGLGGGYGAADPGDGTGAAAAPVPAPVPTWKFAAKQPAGSGRLIVIDPGHGGSDFGAMHNGLTEKVLNFDVSRRLRSLLVARGWNVKMTRESDIDVYAPNDSAHDELQARCDVANNAGAKLFVSVHTNSFTTSSLNGTTTYYYKAGDAGFAESVHARLAATLPTRDDGVKHENFYVIHHTTMPSILVEMAFLSNPGDAALLRTDAFLQKVAADIADGIGDYATENPALLGPSAQAAAAGAQAPGDQ